MFHHVIAARDLGDPRLDSKARAVLMNLASRAGQDSMCNPAVSTIAADTGLSTKSVQRALGYLVGCGHLSYASGQSVGRASRYAVLIDTTRAREMLGHADLPHGRRVRPTDGPSGPAVGQPVPPAGQAAPDGTDTESHRSENEKERSENENKSISLSVSPTVGQTDLPAYKWPTLTEAIAACYKLGCPRCEGEKFYRYNQMRYWNKLATVSLDQLAAAWTDQVRDRAPTVLENEHRRRLEAARLREEQELRRRIEAERLADEAAHKDKETRT